MTRTLTLLSLVAAGLICAFVPRTALGDGLLPTTVTTPEGWSLTLFHSPARGPAGNSRPVLLVPSAGMNRLSFTSEGSDLVAVLNSSGFDVWILERRGSVSSTPPKAGREPSPDITSTDALAADVDAVVSHILSATGERSLFWIGHGLGAHEGVLFALRQPDKVRGLIGLGLAGGAKGSSSFPRRITGKRSLLSSRTKTRFRNWGRAFAGGMHLAPDTNDLHTLFNEPNVSVEVVSQIAASGLEDIPLEVAREVQRVFSGQETVFDEAGLRGATVPLLLVAGRVDPIAPPASSLPLYELWGDSDKDFRTLGEGWGETYDYGHLDLILGDSLRDEVFPDLVSWMSTRGEEPSAGVSSAP